MYRERMRRKKPATAISRHMATPKMISKSSIESIIYGIHTETNTESPYFTERFRERSGLRGVVGLGVGTSSATDMRGTEINKRRIVIEAIEDFIEDLQLEVMEVVQFVHLDVAASLALAWAAVKTCLDFKFTCYALNKIRSPSIRTVPISGLGSLLGGSKEPPPVAVVHGTIQPHPNWLSLRSLFGLDLLDVEDGSGRAVKCVFEEKLWIPPTDEQDWPAYLFGYKLAMFSRYSVPFVIAGSTTNNNNTDFLCVDLDLRNPPLNLPCDTLLPPSWLSSYNPFHSGPRLLLHNILPVGKEINAIGTIHYSNNSLHIKPCHDLPYFLTDLTKDQMVQQLTSKRLLLFLGGIVLPPLSLWVISCTCRRYWRWWKRTN